MIQVPRYTSAVAVNRRNRDVLDLRLVEDLAVELMFRF